MNWLVEKVTLYAKKYVNINGYYKGRKKWK